MNTNNNTIDQNDTIQFIDFIPRSRVSLGSLTLKVYDKNAFHATYLGSDVAVVVREKGLRSLRIAQNKLTGEYFVVFVKDETIGTPVGTTESNSKRLCVRNKALNIFLRKLYKLEDASAFLALSEDLSKVDDMATFKILGVKNEGNKD